jgi:RNA recognition motif-containing protein
MTIDVSHLPYKVSQEDLKEVFAEYGQVKRVVMPTDRGTGRIPGFAFVGMIDSA